MVYIFEYSVGLFRDLIFQKCLEYSEQLNKLQEGTMVFKVVTDVVGSSRDLSGEI